MPPEPRVSTAVRLNANDHAWLVAEAEKRDVSVNFLVGRAVRLYRSNRVVPVDDIDRLQRQIDTLFQRQDETPDAS